MNLVSGGGRGDLNEGEAEPFDGVAEQYPVFFDGVNGRRFPVEEQGEHPAGLAGAARSRMRRVSVLSAKERCAMLFAAPGPSARGASLSLSMPSSRCSWSDVSSP